MFANQVRAELRLQYPTENHMDLSKRAAERWNGMTAAEKSPYCAFREVEMLRFKHAVALYELETPLREWENAAAPSPPPGASSKNHSVFNFWSAQPHVQSNLKAQILQLEPEAAEGVSTTTTPSRTTLPAAAAASSSSGESETGNSGTAKLTQVRPTAFFRIGVVLVTLVDNSFDNRGNSSGSSCASSGEPCHRLSATSGQHASSSSAKTTLMP